MRTYQIPGILIMTLIDKNAIHVSLERGEEFQGDSLCDGKVILVNLVTTMKSSLFLVICLYSTIVSPMNKPALYSYLIHSPTY